MSDVSISSPSCEENLKNSHLLAGKMKICNADRASPLGYLVSKVFCKNWKTTLTWLPWNAVTAYGICVWQSQLGKLGNPENSQWQCKNVRSLSSESFHIVRKLSPALRKLHVVPKMLSERPHSTVLRQLVRTSDFHTFSFSQLVIRTAT